MYGYSLSNKIPLALTYLKALSINPPLHPWFPYNLEQSTNYYSEYDSKVPYLILWSPSNDPVVENAQHDPHYP